MAEGRTTDWHWWQRFGALGGRTLGMLAVILILVAAADRTGWLVDASADRRFTVHPRLAELANAQQEAVELVGVWRLDHDAELAPVEALAKQVAALAPKITWRRIDPELHQPLAAAFAKDHGECQPDMLYVVRGKRMVRVNLGPGIRVILQREIGGALVTLADPSPPQVQFLAGHGELRTSAGPGDGNDQLAHALELAGYAVGSRDPTANRRLPPEAVLVIAGPMSPLGPEITNLSAHLTDGGSALVLADDRSPADLVQWLRHRGVVLGEPPASPEPAATGPALTVVASRYRHIDAHEQSFPIHNLALQNAGDGSLDLIQTEHPISGPVARSGITLFSPYTTGVWPLDPAQAGDQAQALADAYQQVGTPPFRVSVLLRSAPADSWLKPRAVPQDPPEDLGKRGPIPLAAAIEYAPAADSVRAGIGGRLVVWGSRQAGCDGVLARGVFANEELLKRSVDWLARRTAQTSIPPAELTAFRVDCADQTLWNLFIALVIVIPCLFLGGAMLTWWDRR